MYTVYIQYLYLSNEYLNMLECMRMIMMMTDGEWQIVENLHQKVITRRLQKAQKYPPPPKLRLLRI